MRVKRYFHLNFLRAFVFNFERLKILRDSIGHPSKKLLSLEFAHSFCIIFLASRYIVGLDRTSELKVIVVWICSELLYSISSVCIYYGSRSDIWVKSYCRLNLLRASVFNFERLDILRDSIGHPSKRLSTLEFAHSFCILFLVSRYITELNRISELKGIFIWISSELLYSISSVSKYYATQLDIQVENYCR